MTISGHAVVYEIRCPHQHVVGIGSYYYGEHFCEECDEWIEAVEIATVYVELEEDGEVTGWVD